jgi:dipeptidyl aminopeptidase/acylaminoacyl peptidase
MPKQPITLEDLALIKLAGDPQMSPEGTRVVFTVKQTDVDKNKYFTHLWYQPVDGGPARQFTFEDVSDTSPRWSPDGKSIAFLRTKDKRSQLWLIAVDGGEPRKLTELPEGSICELRWAPGSRRLSFCFRPSAAGWTRDAAKKREENGKSKPPRVISRVRYRFDAEGFHDERQHVWVCDIDGGPVKQLTSGDYDDLSAVWSPDGRTIAFVSNRIPDPDRHAYRSDLWLVASNGGKPRRLATPVGSKASLSWSPDGTRIAYVGAEAGDDPWPPKNNRLWVVALDGKARCLTSGLDRTVGETTLSDSREGASQLPIWSADSRRLYFTVSDSGKTHVYAASLDTGELIQLTHGATDVAGLTADAAGRCFALLHGGPQRPGEIYTGELTHGALSLRQLSHINHDWLKTVQLSKPEEFWLTQPDGIRVQGWLLRPPDFNSRQRYPLLLYVHGGPHSQYGNVFFHELQWHAARGYVVAYSNPRGSNGRDTEFGACIHRDWGHLDYQDVMAVADRAQALPYVDPKRMAISGGSYGGFMTNWVAGHTNRFVCGVTDRSICNWISMVGTSDVPPPPGAYWPGVPWGDVMQCGWDRSPLYYVSQVKMPHLIIHSEGDLRCPVSQSEEWFTALKWLKQEATFVRYPQETSHGLSRTGPIDLRFDRLQRIGDWLDKYCLPGSASPKKPQPKSRKHTAKTRAR